jgi:hypothetical protein
VRGREGLVSSDFQGFSIGVMVRQMLMVLLGIMGFQFMPILVGGVADADERLVESKLLEWVPSDTISWRGG